MVTWGQIRKIWRIGKQVVSQFINHKFRHSNYVSLHPYNVLVEFSSWTDAFVFISSPLNWSNNLTKCSSLIFLSHWKQLMWYILRAWKESIAIDLTDPLWPSSAKICLENPLSRLLLGPRYGVLNVCFVRGPQEETQIIVIVVEHYQIFLWSCHTITFVISETNAAVIL